MGVSKEFIEFWNEQFQSFTNCQSRKMFGGVGTYHNKAMFALISCDDEIYLKCNDSNRGDFKESGMLQFTNMPYYECSSAFLEDIEI